MMSINNFDPLVEIEVFFCMRATLEIIASERDCSHFAFEDYY